MSRTPEPGVGPAAEVVYELRPMRERLLSGPRRWALRVLLLIAWLTVITVVGWALQLGFASAIVVGGVAPLIGVVGLTLVKPNARRVVIVVTAAGKTWTELVARLTQAAGARGIPVTTK